MAKIDLIGRFGGGVTDALELARGAAVAVADLMASPFAKEGAVLVIGLPNAGKTVFFNVMLNKLQHLFNAYEGKFFVRYDNDETQNRVSDAIERLRESKWPDVETKYEISHVTIACTDNRGKPVEKKLAYVDYGGEVLAGLSPAEADALSADSEAVDNLKKSVGSASKIMLVVDATMLGEKIGNESDKNFSRILQQLLEAVQNANKAKKIALIFTKGDMLDEETKNNAEKLFRDRYRNVYSYLKSTQVKFKAFLVTAVKCPDLRTPPKDFDSAKHSEGLIEPIEWLLDIKVPVEE
jgi:GTPase SAR1 family protein